MPKPLNPNGVTGERYDHSDIFFGKLERCTGSGACIPRQAAFKNLRFTGEGIADNHSMHRPMVEPGTFGATSFRWVLIRHGL